MAIWHAGDQGASVELQRENRKEEGAQHLAPPPREAAWVKQQRPKKIQDRSTQPTIEPSRRQGRAGDRDGGWRPRPGPASARTRRDERTSGLRARGADGGSTAGGFAVRNGAEDWLAGASRPAEGANSAELGAGHGVRPRELVGRSRWRVRRVWRRSRQCHGGASGGGPPESHGPGSGEP